MTNEMIERVAATLQKELSGYLQEAPDFERLARATITAMREPTPAMMAISVEGISREWLDADWKAMIDAALEKEPA